MYSEYPVSSRGFELPNVEVIATHDVKWRVGNPSMTPNFYLHDFKLFKL